MKPTTCTKPIVRGYTIDPQGSIDLDDGWDLSWNKEETVFQLDVAIAHVVDKIAYRSPLFLDAYRMAETDYPDHNISVWKPMIDVKTTKSISLLGKKMRPAVIVRFIFTKDDTTWNMESFTLFEGRFYSRRQMTYKQADTLLHNQSGMSRDDYIIHIKLTFLLSLARYLKATTGARRTTRELHDGYEGDSHDIIEELMILTNQTLAQWLYEKDISCLYRNHAATAYYLNKEGKLVCSSIYTQDEVHELCKQYTHSEFGPKMNPECATYNLELLGHYGLFTQHYGHFTSPIRRLPDFINQYIIVSILRDRPIPIDEHELRLFALHSNFVRATKRGAERKDTLYAAIKNMMKREGDMRGLSSRTFAQLLAMGVDKIDKHAPFIQELQEELLYRMEYNYSMADTAYIILLFGTDWKELHDKALRCIRTHKRQKSILALLDKEMEHVTLAIDSISTPHRYQIHLLVDKDNEEMLTLSAEGVATREGEQTVAMDVLEQYYALETQYGGCLACLCINKRTRGISSSSFFSCEIVVYII